MFAVSATRTNQGAAKIIAQRNAELKAQERLKLEDQVSASSEAERKASEQLASIRRAAEIVSKFRVIAIGETERQPIRQIVMDAIEGSKFGYDDIIGHRRMREMTDTRHYIILCVWAMRPDLSTTQLGKHLGGRDHSTIIHAKGRFGFESREEAARFIKQHGRDATLARLVKQAA